MRIEKKIWPEFFEKIKSGKKRFEIRLADFKISAGDTLVLREWDPKTKDYTGRELEAKVALVNKVDLLRFYTPEEIEKHGVYVILLES